MNTTTQRMSVTELVSALNLLTKEEVVNVFNKVSGHGRKLGKVYSDAYAKHSSKAVVIEAIVKILGGTAVVIGAVHGNVPLMIGGTIALLGSDVVAKGAICVLAQGTVLYDVSAAGVSKCSDKLAKRRERKALKASKLNGC